MTSEEISLGKYVTSIEKAFTVVQTLARLKWFQPDNLSELAGIAEALFKGKITEKLAAILRAYQLFHGLNQTGELDGPTLRSLDAPRYCSQPDVLNASADNKWPTNQLRYFIINPGGFPGLTSEEVWASFDWAWNEWAKVCDISCSRAASAAQAHVVITCARIDGAMGTLAWSELANGSNTQKSQRYDNGESWVKNITVNVPNNKIDLCRVAAHEIGHVIGIGHISNGNLLAPTYSRTVSTPQAGDIAEAVSRYGLPQTPPPVDPPTTPQDWKVTITGKGDKPTVKIE